MLKRKSFWLSGLALIAQVPAMAGNCGAGVGAGVGNPHCSGGPRVPVSQQAGIQPATGTQPPARLGTIMPDHHNTVLVPTAVASVARQTPTPVPQPGTTPMQVPTPTPQATPPQVPQLVAQPMRAPQQVPTPTPQATPQPVPQTVAQPMQVPQQVPTLRPLATPPQVPQLVAQPMRAPQQVPTPTPQATPQPVPQTVVQPMQVPQQMPTPTPQATPQQVPTAVPPVAQRAPPQALGSVPAQPVAAVASSTTGGDAVLAPGSAHPNALLVHAPDIPRPVTSGALPADGVHSLEFIEPGLQRRTVKVYRTRDAAEMLYQDTIPLDRGGFQLIVIGTRNPSYIH